MSNRRRPNSRNRADLKANMARGAASAVGQIPVLVGRPEDMAGFSLYKVGEVVVGMPTLLPGAPKSVKRRYLGRIIANGNRAEAERAAARAFNTAVLNGPESWRQVYQLRSVADELEPVTVPEGS